MGAFQTPQRYLTIRKRQFHFVAYEAIPGNPKRSVIPSPAMWFLMVEGRRLPVMPYEKDQPDEAVDQQLTQWVKETLGPARRTPQPTPGPELWEE